MQQPDQQNNPPGNQQNISSQQQPKYPLVNPPIGITQSHKEEEKWRDHQREYFKQQISVAKSLNVITTLAAGIALLGLYFVYEQAKTASISADAAVKQARTAENTLKVSERSWVTIKHAKFSLKSKNDPGQVLIILKNTGHTPAINVRVSYSALFIDKLPTGPMQIGPISDKQSRGVLGPETSMQMVAKPQMSNGSSGGKIFTFGIIEYEDRITENIPHRTTFCFQLPLIKSDVENYALMPCANDWNDAS